MSEQELQPRTNASDEHRESDGRSSRSPDEPALDDETSAALPNSLAVLHARIRTIRQYASHRRLALGIAVLVGLLATTWHWFGLVLGGALVGLTRQTLPRALAAGFGFGCLVLGGFLVTLQLSVGIAPTQLRALAPLSTLTVVLTLLAPTWGALLRGAV